MWKCRQCGETRQRNFSTCRSCGAARRPGSSAGLRTQRLSPMAVPSGCPKCASPNMISNARIVEREEIVDNIMVEVQRNPDAMLFKRPEQQRLRARVCGQCGYTELYADKPERLWDAFAESQRS